jgi:hypothetical protein
VAGVSAYDVRVPAPDLLPAPAEAARLIGEVEVTAGVAGAQAQVEGWCRA